MWPVNSNLSYLRLNLSWSLVFAFFKFLEHPTSLWIKMNEEGRKARNSFALQGLLDEQRVKRVKTNSQIFYSASMMTSKTAHVKSSSLLRRSISDSVERNVHRVTTLHEVRKKVKKSRFIWCADCFLETLAPPLKTNPSKEAISNQWQWNDIHDLRRIKFKEKRRRVKKFCPLLIKLILTFTKKNCQIWQFFSVVCSFSFLAAKVWRKINPRNGQKFQTEQEKLLGD